MARSWLEIDALGFRTEVPALRRDRLDPINGPGLTEYFVLKSGVELEHHDASLAGLVLRVVMNYCCTSLKSNCHT